VKIYARLIFFLCSLFLLLSCATTAEVTQGDGPTISQAQAEDYDGPKARIAVGSIIDKSGSGDSSLTHQFGLMHKKDRSVKMKPADMVSGIKDMMTTALFGSNRYIVLERDNINDVLVEQEFSDSGRVGTESKIPKGEIEGADLLVVGAVTAFDAGLGGFSLPIPIPLNRGRDIAILNLSFKKSYIAMDVRVIDAKTARVLAAVAVEGSATKVGAGLGGLARTRYGYIHVPVLLSGFANTPVEKAITEMVTLAVDNIVNKTPAVYYRH